MNFLLRGVDRVSQIFGLSVAHFYLVCALLTAYEVVSRYVFNSPTLWAFEVVMVVCATAWALSGAYVTMRRSHIAITVLYQHTRGRLRWALDLLIQLTSLAAMLVLAYAVWPMMFDALRTIERSGSSFNSPEPLIIKTALFVGVVLYALQTLANLIRHFEGIGRAPRPDLDVE
jgi:TRAP-type mannitol/chloroaromatic compound transport system permease small subunit